MKLVFYHLIFFYLPMDKASGLNKHTYSPQKESMGYFECERVKELKKVSVLYLKYV